MLGRTTHNQCFHFSYAVLYFLTDQSYFFYLTTFLTITMPQSHLMALVIYENKHTNFNRHGVYYTDSVFNSRD